MKSNEILCYCGATNCVESDMFGGELECAECGTTLCVPEEDTLEVYNEETKAGIEKSRQTGKVRVMIEDECGEERTLFNNVEPEHAEFMLAGIKERYPESRRVFTEPETYAVFNRFLDI